MLYMYFKSMQSQTLNEADYLYVKFFLYFRIYIHTPNLQLFCLEESVNLLVNFLNSKGQGGKMMTNLF